MNTHNTKPMTKKEYAKKVLNDPKLVESFKSAIDAELLEEHQQTLKFKNALWSLGKIRALIMFIDKNTYNQASHYFFFWCKFAHQFYLNNNKIQIPDINFE